MVKTVNLSLLDGTNGFTLNGIDRRDASGYSVSSAGDVNGDGYDDLIIGARGAGPGGKDSAGETYVVYGGASAPGANGRARSVGAGRHDRLYAHRDRTG